MLWRQNLSARVPKATLLLRNKLAYSGWIMGCFGSFKTLTQMPVLKPL